MPLARIPIRSDRDWYRRLDTIRQGHIPHTGRRRMLAGGIGMVKELRRLGVWKPGDRVLDVGCGNGRLAVGVVASHAPIARYVGIDCLQASIAWCRETFAPWPEFEFRHLDVRNWFYNRDGTIPAEQALFPLDDATVDAVVCWSLFTHIERCSAASRYLAEIHRVLKPGGRAYTTWFRSPPHSLPSPSPKKTVFVARDIERLIDPFRVIHIAADNVGTVSKQCGIVLEKKKS